MWLLLYNACLDPLDSVRSTHKTKGDDMARNLSTEEVGEWDQKPKLMLSYNLSKQQICNQQQQARYSGSCLQYQPLGGRSGESASILRVPGQPGLHKDTLDQIKSINKPIHHFILFSFSPLPPN